VLSLFTGIIETALYRKAGSGLLKGDFPGVTVSYEKPEALINSEGLTPFPAPWGVSTYLKIPSCLRRGSSFF
jgi:hypothetical protein